MRLNQRFVRAAITANVLLLLSSCGMRCSWKFASLERRRMGIIFH